MEGSERARPSSMLAILTFSASSTMSPAPPTISLMAPSSFASRRLLSSCMRCWEKQSDELAKSFQTSYNGTLEIIMH
ncbi:hypothetical protein IHE45_02G084000 [Dioscorea alata]|uniref:Uncharacterized protein n=1 Tax=Dioscorea alata TaxID=55571 RepID=A0ACB7WRI8_DIOAL|nr:hypothetical protein IHE45_02G084000 [Dioscorea alata]